MGLYWADEDAAYIRSRSTRYLGAEITLVLQADGRTAYFGADTLLIPELSEVADRYLDIDVALLPINACGSARCSTSRS